MNFIPTPASIPPPNVSLRLAPARNAAANNHLLVFASAWETWTGSKLGLSSEPSRILVAGCPDMPKQSRSRS